MGLEGTEFIQKMGSSVMDQLPLSALGIDLVDGCSSLMLAAGSDDYSSQMQLLMQAQALLKKSSIYQKIDEALHTSHLYHPNVSNNLPQTTDDDERITSLHRDAAVNNLRFLNIFYGYAPATFALAVNLLDRLLGKVKAHPKYLSCIATGCFYIAVKTQEAHVFIPCPLELVKLSQCGGADTDLMRMERLILDKLQWQTHAVTPLTFLQYFYDVFTDKDVRLHDPAVLSSFIAKLEVLLCQFEFTKYRAETLALALLSYVLQDMGVLNNLEHFTAVVELQYYCQISDCEFLQCRGLLIDYLALYVSQPSKLPRLQLTWTVSRRTLNKLRPSTKVLLDLETIFEDEVDEFGMSEESDDAGPFDSENDDNELSQPQPLHLSQPQPAVNTCSSSNYAAEPYQQQKATSTADQRSMEQGNNQEHKQRRYHPAVGGELCPLQDKCTELSFILHSDDDDDDDYGEEEDEEEGGNNEAM